MQGITNKNKLHNYNHKKKNTITEYTNSKEKRNWILIKLSAGQKNALYCEQGSKKMLDWGHRCTSSALQVPTVEISPLF